MKDTRKPLNAVVNYILIALAVCGGNIMYNVIQSHTKNNIEMLMMFSIITGFFFGSYNVLTRWQYIKESAIMYRSVQINVKKILTSLDEIKK